MFRLTPHTPILHTPRLALAAAIAFGLSGCGGGAADSLGNASRSATLANAEQPQDAQPHFHIAPVLLDQPTSMDADGSEASAHEAAASQAVLARLEHVSSARLELETLKRKTEEVISQEGPKPATSTSTVASVYTPAQIRAAYQLPPMAGVNLTGNPALGAATAAQFGSGQTIYIIDAYNDPNVASDLAQFSAQWGLPTCTRLTIAASTKLPLAAAPAGSGCEFAVVYASQSGVLSASVPAYSSGWAPEISLDTQWSHAIAPMARIILIEAQDASSPSILGAIKLANSLGPGVVSMSFGSPEGSYVPSYDGMFTTKGMSYVASTGDSGVGVAWPAVSTNVLGVGGTSLTLGSNNVRSETAWSGSSGGISTTEPLPSWQPAYVIAASGSTKATSSTHRELPDVSFNANPYTGQYVYMTPPGSSGEWLSAGGTSIGAPQWAALITLANAERQASAKAAIGLTQTDLYKEIYDVKGTYTTTMLDVTSGSNGSCASCQAGVGYDLVTGMGTPNALSVLKILEAY